MSKIKHAKPTELPEIDLGKLVKEYETVALVLQGGGALGSYQAGVFEGLEEAGIRPNLISGISIGALNAAIIAGNAPEDRLAKLREFWNTICTPAVLPSAFFSPTTWFEHFTGDSRKLLNVWEAGRAVLEGQKGFYVPRVPFPLAGVASGPKKASYYDTAPLKSTLERLVDFDRIKAQEIRVSVGAVNVATGNFKYFDNSNPKMPLRAEHFMASGALPPAFPAVEIDGEFYWDGGLISNTPLYDVLKSHPHGDTLAFQVDLWSAQGKLPENLYDVSERVKDIQYSSRTRMITDYMREMQDSQRMVHDLLQLIPAEDRKKLPICQNAEKLGCSTSFNVIHLIYRDKEYEGHFKDYEFGLLTMREHWLSGLEDIRRTLLHPQWLKLPPPDKPFITHDVHRRLESAETK